MSSSNQDILKQFRLLLEKSVDLHSITLFGSRARGDFDPASDMDVLVIMDRLDAEVDKTVSECAWQVGLKNGVLIVPVTYSRDEWESGPERSSLLAQAVKLEGVPA